jgi:hypothetical protein
MNGYSDAYFWPVHEGIDADKATATVDHWPAGMTRAEVETGGDPFALVVSHFRELRTTTDDDARGSSPFDAPGKTQCHDEIASGETTRIANVDG